MAAPTPSNLVIPSNLVWHKSTHSNGDGNVCVEVALLPGGAALRDSKDRAGEMLLIPTSAWDCLRAAVCAG
jgi:hypothetical protein